LLSKFTALITKTFQIRDELSFKNIRGFLWPVLLIFPLSVISGDVRFFNLGIEMFGLHSYQLMLYPLGLGWLVMAFVPKNLSMPILRTAALCCVSLLPFQIMYQFFIDNETIQLSFFMVYQFFNGICAACAFSLFCFKLNNVERLFGMMMILFYYSLFYIFYRRFPIVQEIYKSWGGVTVVLIYLVIVFACTRLKHEEINEANESGKNSGALFCIILFIVYYMIMCMINYIEFAEGIIYGLPYGLGQFAAILLIGFIMMMKSNNALYIWLMFLVFSLLGISILIYDTNTALFSGSLVYGMGDGLGYIIVYYICAGAIKQSKSFKVYKIYCFVFFIQYFIISGLYSLAFDNFDGEVHLLALGIVLFLCSACFLLIPLVQKKLFEVDWSDGLYLRDMEQYSKSLAETQAQTKKEKLNLTVREEEILTMLLGGSAPKEIAFILKISYDTTRFHQKNLYRKLGIKSIQELFTRYGVESAVKAK